MNKTKSKSNDKFIINNISFKNRIKFFRDKALENVEDNKQFSFYPYFSVLPLFQRFIPISAFYPHFSVLSPIQCFIPISAFYPYFSVLSPFQRFNLISAFYPHLSHFSVLFPFQFSFSVSVSAIQFQRFISTQHKLWQNKSKFNSYNSMTRIIPSRNKNDQSNSSFL